jgi:hypothetical protein
VFLVLLIAGGILVRLGADASQARGMGDQVWVRGGVLGARRVLIGTKHKHLLYRWVAMCNSGGYCEPRSFRNAVDGSKFKMAKTRVNYLYRDASNWKFRGSVMIDGVVTVDDVKPYLFDSDYFVPHEVAFEHLLNLPMNQDDHYLHEFESFDLVEEDQTLCSRAEFIERFKTAAEKGWFHTVV